MYVSANTVFKPRLLPGFGHAVQIPRTTSSNVAVGGEGGGGGRDSMVYASFQ